MRRRAGRRKKSVECQELAFGFGEERGYFLCIGEGVALELREEISETRGRHIGQLRLLLEVIGLFQNGTRHFKIYITFN